MQSALERYLIEKLQNARSFSTRHDRGVVIGAALSFTPIFPACWIGFVISVLNLSLLKRGRLSRNEEKIVHLSLAVSAVFSLIWLWIISHIGDGIITFFSGVANLIFAPSGVLL
jgi:hypothetical protein